MRVKFNKSGGAVTGNTMCFIKGNQLCIHSTERNKRWNNERHVQANYPSSVSSILLFYYCIMALFASLLVGNQLLLRNHSWPNGHCLQLLKQQFRRIRHMNVRKAGRIAASAAQPNTLLRVDHSHQAAVLTRIARELIGAFHQTLFRELCHSVCDDTISLHFSKTQTRFHLAL